MKKIILIIGLLCFSNLFSQEIRYEEVIKVDSTRTAKELFNTGKLWINEAYKSGKAVIEMENEEAGIILGKATYKYNPDFFVSSVPAKGYIEYTIKISFKNGRYKYEFYDFSHQGSSSPTAHISQDEASVGLINDGEKYTGSNRNLNKGYRNKVNEDCQKQIKKFIPKTILSLNSFMINPKTILNNKNDW